MTTNEQYDEAVTLWLASPARTPRSRFVPQAGVVQLAEFEDLVDELKRLTESGAEVERIVVDRHLPQLHVLQLLSGLPHSFRGDVVYVASNITGFLSAVGPHDGRFLFELSRRDLDFYFEAVFVRHDHSANLDRVQRMEQFAVAM